LTKIKFESKLFEDLKDEIEEIRVAQNEVLTQTKETLIAALKAFIKEHKELEQLTWTQYTPHFNDGDACIFGVRSLEVKIEGDEELYDTYYFKGNKQKTVSNSKEIVAALNDLETFMNEETTEIVLKKEFGDGVRVIVTRKSIEVEDYDHE